MSASVQVCKFECKCASVSYVYSVYVYSVYSVYYVNIG